MTHFEHRRCADLISCTPHDQKYASLVVMILGLSICLSIVGYCQADHAAGAGPKTLSIIFGRRRLWQAFQRGLGHGDGGARDTDNGLEDTTMEFWNNWDRKILRGPDGRYRMFASRWDQGK